MTLNTSADKLNYDFEKINDWSFHWKTIMQNPIYPRNTSENPFSGGIEMDHSTKMG